MPRFRHGQDISDEKECEINSIIKPGKEWLVKFNGTYWHAITHPGSSLNDLTSGDQICVVGRKGLKLLIEHKGGEN